MSCADGICGTGGWTGPLPGDPDNNVVLSAVTVFGGVDVSWTYPTTNPEAVAHTLLYRSFSADFSTALLRAFVAGNQYHDKLDPDDPTEVYYWIKIVSVHGTTGEPIGPAMATAVSVSGQIVDMLEGKVHYGMLAPSMKLGYSSIALLDEKILLEIDNRISGNLALSGALSEVQSDIDQALTLVSQEVTQRATADSALVNSLNILAAGFGDSAAALTEEIEIRAAKDDVLARQVTAVGAILGAIASADVFPTVYANE